MSLLRKISSSFGSSEAVERQSTCDALIEAFLKEHPAPERNAWRGAPEPRKSVARRTNSGIGSRAAGGAFAQRGL